jgi:hypothetical protein
MKKEEYEFQKKFAFPPLLGMGICRCQSIGSESLHGELEQNVNVTKEVQRIYVSLNGTSRTFRSYQY